LIVVEWIFEILAQILGEAFVGRMPKGFQVAFCVFGLIAAGALVVYISS
jgi:hypothetical protein